MRDTNSQNEKFKRQISTGNDIRIYLVNGKEIPIMKVNLKKNEPIGLFSKENFPLGQIESMRQNLDIIVNKCGNYWNSFNFDRRGKICNPRTIYFTRRRSGYA